MNATLTTIAMAVGILFLIWIPEITEWLSKKLGK